MIDKKTFGSFIKEKRKNKNYSQKDLADLLYVTESAVSKWERGVTYPDITLITDICRVLDITEKELIQSSDDTEYRKIKQNSDKYNKLKKTLFWIINICYSVAVITCFIVNLAVNHTLSCFFIVLTSLVTSYTFCPTLMWICKKYKLLIFIGSTFISLFLLFLVCSIYTNNYWFMIPTVSLLLGYFIIFYPILFTSQKKYLDNYNSLAKWFLLTYFAGILLLILLLLIIIYCYKPFNLLLGILITGGCMMLPLIISIFRLFSLSINSLKIVVLVFVGLIVLVSTLGIIRAVYYKNNAVSNTYIIEEVFDKINIDVDIENINLYLTDSKSKIVCVENNNYTIESEIINGSLNINRRDNRKFYDKILNFTNYKLDLYLSKEDIILLKINSSTGDITINEGINFNNVDINNSTGNIIFESNVRSELKVDNSTGDITISKSNLNNVFVSTKTGYIKLIDVNCQKLDIQISTGDTKLINVLVKDNCYINGKTGSVYLDGFDASNIYITLSTGDVKGTILTSKFFTAISKTGNVSVPKTREGGECNINVSTGDINIGYK